ncbi:glycosyltransferase [Bacillus sp. Marseille-P3661]|uniref:glycosyltransferase n=1 Tax=Bacillus sp. Marseille-P3661 TaxID=1936234 RepID=UPI000C8496FB|nr:glycosyltransferase [Bacillus sp. Marseille-P3661]
MENLSESKIIFKFEDTPVVSIIISVHNKWNLTYACLNSIKEYTEDIPYEIILNDNGSTDETTNISKYVENINVLRDGTNRGYLLGCNHAAKFARGKYILLLNNDTLVTEKWLSVLVDTIENDERIGMVGSKLIYPDGRLQEAGGIVWRDATPWNYGKGLDANQPQFNYVKEVDYITGACTMIRASLWREIGGYDERFIPSYYEDTDLAFEVRNHGYKVVYQPLSVVIHFEHGTNGKDAMKKYILDNKMKFRDKWKETLNREHFETRRNIFLARDRSRNKKSILVIDHHVPMYDMDAGSKYIYNYLKVFVKLGLRVVFITDNFVKHEPYATELEQMGIEILYGYEYFKTIKNWIRKYGRYFHYVYLIRPHTSIKYIDSIKKYCRGKIFYNAIDIHYLREFRRYKVTKSPKIKKEYLRWKRIETKLFKSADVIHVVSMYEQKILEKKFPSKIIRTLPIYYFEQGAAKDIASYESRKGIIFVGNFNHRPNADAVSLFIHNILPIVKKELPDVPFYVVGAEGHDPPKQYHEIKKLNGDQIIVTGYVSEQELKDYYNKARVAIAPLRFGAGVKGKVAEALYFRVPMVTTKIGAEGYKDINQYISIENANDANAFANEIIRIYKNKQAWESISNNSRHYVDQYFTLATAINEINKDIN